MAIVKMKAVTIAAQISEFDTVVEKYVYGRDIHLENAMSVISNRGKLKNFDAIEKIPKFLNCIEF